MISKEYYNGNFIMGGEYSNFLQIIFLK